MNLRPCVEFLISYLLATRWVSSGNTNYFPAYDGNGNVVQYLTTAGVVNTHYESDNENRMSNAVEYVMKSEPNIKS
jgi:hypothetical protein